MARPRSRHVPARIASWLAAVMVDLLLAIILGVIAWIMRRLPERWLPDIAAKHRDALHSALNNGVGLVIDTVQKHLCVLTPDLAMAKTMDHLGQRFPSLSRSSSRRGPCLNTWLAQSCSGNSTSC